MLAVPLLTLIYPNFLVFKINRHPSENVSNKIITKNTSKGTMNYLVLRNCIFKPFEVLNSVEFKVLQRVYLLEFFF